MNRGKFLTACFVHLYEMDGRQLLLSYKRLGYRTHHNLYIAMLTYHKIFKATNNLSICLSNPEPIAACNDEFLLRLRSVYKELHADHETGAADNKLRLNTKHRKSARYSACFVVRGFQRGLPLGTRLCLQSVVCYTLCRRCRENTVAAGEGKGI